MIKKQRLDLLLCETGLAPSREKARGLIMAGEVSVDGSVIDKPGSQVSVSAQLSVRTRPRFVSRGGEKLVAALESFAIDVRGLCCADIGASTGGFTDCLLQRGASRIYAIDVGYGQLDYRLRQDARVIVMERTNARYLDTLPELLDLVVIDASFISLKLLLPSVIRWLAISADIIALIKPQFEAGRGEIGKGGVVRSAETHSRVIRDILDFAAHQALTPRGLIRSPLKGPAGNSEFLAHLSFGRDCGDDSLDLESRIAQVVSGT